MRRSTILLASLLASVTPGIASADDVSDVELREEAERVEQLAKANQDLELYDSCGEIYLELFNRAPDADLADEVLYNAGVCYEEGRSIGTAIGLYQMLETNFPKSRLAAKATARLGMNYGNIGWYREAAEKLEAYATKYPGEDHAASAMSDAVYYRKALGDDDKAIADTRYYIKTFGQGSKKRGEAAAAEFGLAEIYERQGDPDKVVAHLRSYIKTYGKAGVDRLVMAYAKIGESLWQQACAAKAVDGACIRVDRARAATAKAKKGKKARKAKDQGPRFCNAATAVRITVVERDAKLVAEATKALEAAVAAYEASGGKTGGDDAVAKHFYARARLLLADAAYEAYLAQQLPAGLDFDDTTSAKRFSAWLQKKTRAGATASDRFLDILQVRDAATSIAVTARIGQIAQALGNALYDVEIPKAVRSSPESTEVYCDKLGEVAEPTATKAREAFETCLHVSTEMGWFSEWSQLCERELGLMDPERYPVASELRATPDPTFAFTTLEAPILTYAE